MTKSSLYCSTATRGILDLGWISSFSYQIWNQTMLYTFLSKTVLKLTLKENVVVWPKDKDGQHFTTIFFLTFFLTQMLPSSPGDVICSCNQLERAGTISSNISYTLSLTQSSCPSFSPFYDQTSIEDIQLFCTAWTLNNYSTVFLQYSSLFVCNTKRHYLAQIPENPQQMWRAANSQRGVAGYVTHQRSVLMHWLHFWSARVQF